MKPTYEVKVLEDGHEIILQTNPDGTIWSFLKDEANPNYQAYLRWLENPDAEETQGGIN